MLSDISDIPLSNVGASECFKLNFKSIQSFNVDLRKASAIMSKSFLYNGKTRLFLVIVMKRKLQGSAPSDHYRQWCRQCSTYFKYLFLKKFHCDGEVIIDLPHWPLQRFLCCNKGFFKLLNFPGKLSDPLILLKRPMLIIMQLWTTSNIRKDDIKMCAGHKILRIFDKSEDSLIKNISHKFFFV